MQYGTLLKRAWNIIWRNKIIWLFGFLAALGSGGNNFNFRSGGNFNFPSQGQGTGGGLPPQVQRALVELFSNQSLIITVVIVLIVVGLVIGLIIALIAALGHSAMVEMAREADETERTSFATGWNTGLRRMFPTFLIRFLLGLPPALILIAGLIPFFLSFVPLMVRSGFSNPERLFAGGILTSLFACFLPACCIGVLLSIPLQVLETLSIRALVLESTGIWSSIRRGWSIFTSNLGEVIILWLIFLVIGIAVGIVIGLPIAFLAIAILVPMGIAAAVTPLMIAPLIALICLIAILSAVLRSVVEAYTSTLWTLAYRQWSARPVSAPVPVPATV
jgi:hypothetical protein